jgi:hypothetical protein
MAQDTSGQYLGGIGLPPALALAADLRHGFGNLLGDIVSDSVAYLIDPHRDETHCSPTPI